MNKIILIIVLVTLILSSGYFILLDGINEKEVKKIDFNKIPEKDNYHYSSIEEYLKMNPEPTDYVIGGEN